MSKKVKKLEANPEEDKQFPLPIYDKKEDIYNHGEEVPLDEQGEVVKGRPLEADNDLDVPGSELDDEDEAIGEEDEENNYYSLGGDNHDDLEEDRE
ncbi:hypothetical protein [Paraflavitalea sp. CAU 1676]|uniref:hypothetical protein n=1 Tax=Paraflavitalea sp. CAU 1676 TaxID=3032598 RepID=UPI0023DCAD52|nr:hypothetical protein [Paraflavitalea sp. CAU 1676]MDF2188432.1 hypothetical protein [Paraflavitalea sp. CAU 1676]